VNQYLVAGLAIFVFSIFCLAMYIYREERKRPQIPHIETGPDTIEKRARRAF
jgi:hypothetical protein